MSKGYSITQVLSLKQTTILAPQLQQGLHLLHLSSLDLQQEIENELQSNPFLEKTELDFLPIPDSAKPEISTKDQQQGRPGSNTLIQGAAPSLSPKLQANSTAGQRLSSQGDASTEREFQLTPELTLNAYLHQQARATPLSDKQHYILELLIDSVNEKGYLRANFTDIVELAMPDYVVTNDDVQQMLKVLQDFEPVGVGARTASECLLLQLRDKPADTPGLELARQIARQYLPLLAKQKIEQIAQALSLDSHALDLPIALIRQLNPFPGTAIASQTQSYITPDLLVKKIQARWVVRLNPNVVPAISMHNESKDLLRLARGKKGYKQLRQEWQKAQYLLSNLERRYQTLLQVADIIVDRQSQYFEQGEAALVPLAQKDIAEELGVHVSTISRAVNDKYMLTPAGVVELRYFFSTAIQRTGGASISAKAIQARIVAMIKQESPQKPLSDNKITQALNQRGIMVARRTVAKYRELANIPASSKRRGI